MDAAAAKSFKLDASAGGCSGMFWRTKPEMGSTTSSSDWPRNGTMLKGWYVAEHPGWVKIDHPEGYWMPVEQHGKAVMHEVDSYAVKLLRHLARRKYDIIVVVAVEGRLNMAGRPGAGLVKLRDTD